MGRGRRVLAANIAIAALLGGCSLLLDLDPGVRDSAGDGDAGPSDGDSGPGGDAGPCGSVGRLQDSFAPGALSTRWVPHTLGDEAAGPAISDTGRLAVGFEVAPATDDELSEVESRFAYDLRGHSVTVWTEVDDDRSWSTLEVREAAAFDAPRRIIALGRKGTVFAAFVRSPAEEVLRQEVFDQAAYRYWRIREVAGALEFEVAGADQVFSRFSTLDLPGLDLGTVMVGLGVFADVTPQTVGLTHYDDLNTDEEAEPACPLAGLRDDFTAGALGALWIDDSNGCTVSTGDGLSLSTGGGATCVVNSAHAYSITGGDELTVDLADLPASPGARTELRLLHDDDDYLALQQQDGELSIVLVEGGVGGGPSTFPNPDDAQRWRVRERDGQLEVATATAGGSFSQRDSVTVRNLDLAELRVSLQVRVNAADSARFAAVNLAP